MPGGVNGANGSFFVGMSEVSARELAQNKGLDIGNIFDGSGKVEQNELDSLVAIQAKASQQAASAEKAEPPKDTTENIPPKEEAVPQEANAFNPDAKGTDPQTGANLNGTPLKGVKLVKRHNYGGSHSYEQKVNGNTYYYNENKQLTCVNNRSNKLVLDLYYSDDGKLSNYVRYNDSRDGNLQRYDVRYPNGELKYSRTYEYTKINGKTLQTRSVDRSSGGDVIKYHTSDYDSNGNQMYLTERDSDGNVKWYHDFKSDKSFLRDGTEMEKGKWY